MFVFPKPDSPSISFKLEGVSMAGDDKGTKGNFAISLSG